MLFCEVLMYSGLLSVIFAHCYLIYCLLLMCLNADIVMFLATCCKVQTGVSRMNGANFNVCS